MHLFFFHLFINKVVFIELAGLDGLEMFFLFFYLLVVILNS